MTEPFEPNHTCRCLKCYGYRQEGDALRAENSLLKGLLREVLPDSMGGVPDMFWPTKGWDDWEERAKDALEEA